MNLTVAVTDMALYGILFLLGLAICFFGYRLIRAWLFIAGLQVGFSLGLWLGDMIFKSPLVVMIGAVLLGIIMAALFGFLIKAGGFLAGAGIMVLLVLLLANLFGIPAGISAYILLAAALLGGVLGILTVKPFLILATAVNGAFMAADSIFGLINGHQAGQILVVHTQMSTVHLILLLVGTLVLAILGAMVQFWMAGKVKNQPAGSTATEPAAPSVPSPGSSEPGQVVPSEEDR